MDQENQISIEVCRSFKGLGHFCAGWDALVEQTAYSVFQTYGWCRICPKCVVHKAFQVSYGYKIIYLWNKVFKMAIGATRDGNNTDFPSIASWKIVS